jgi:predicted small lipoprotein YifL
MKRMTCLVTVLISVLLFSACGQSGPLYIPGNPSQMAVPPSKDATVDEKKDEEKQDTTGPSNPE